MLEHSDFFQGRTCTQLGSKHLPAVSSLGLCPMCGALIPGLPPSQGSLPPETKSSRPHFSTASQQAGQGFIRPDSQLYLLSAQYRFLPLSFHHEHLASKTVFSVNFQRTQSSTYICFICLLSCSYHKSQENAHVDPAS